MNLSFGILFLCASTFQQDAEPIVILNAVPAPVVSVASPQERAAEKVDIPQVPILRFQNGDFITGEWAESPAAAETIQWNSPLFRDPLSFTSESVESISLPPSKEDKELSFAYRVELMTGSVIQGELVSLDEKQLAVDVPDVGRVSVDRNSIRRIQRRDQSNGLILSGPAGLSWTLRKGWQVEAGTVVSRERDSTLVMNASFPALVFFEFELSWDSKADFDLAIGSRDSTIPAVCHFEVWGEQLVMVSESQKKADVAAIQTINPNKPGRIQLQIYMDRKKGRVIVFTNNTAKEVELVPPEPEVVLNGDGFYLINKGGDLRLDRIQVSKWSGDAPQPADAGKTRFLRTDGSVIYGDIKSYVAEEHRFVLVENGADKSEDEKQLRELVFGSLTPIEAGPWSAELKSGLSVNGQLLKYEQGKFVIQVTGIAEPIAIPIGVVSHLKHQLAKRNKPKPEPHEAQLEADGVSLRGKLAETTASESTSLGFQSIFSKTGTTFASGAIARIMYLDGPLPKRARPTTANQAVPAGPNRVIFGFSNTANSGAQNTPAKTKPRPKTALHVLHLTSGDVIPCVAKIINEKGVEFETELSKANFVPNDQIRALELMPDVGPVSIAKSKRERLLTLPRIQKNSPPTHLVRSATGDYLRCRLLEMNEKTLEVEIRLENRSIPRNSVARILWLSDNPVQVASPTNESVPNLVQAVYSNGNRVTLSPERVEGLILTGTSKMLGPCRIELKDINALLLGGAIDQTASTLTFHQWKLRAAPEPLPSESPGEGSSEGQESALVGKPAPDFELKLLDGKSFHLADHKHSIVVLDFWASWCGPCLQTMPQVEKVTKEFADQKVMLVGINLEESGAKVKVALERLDLDMTVALDDDGRTAEKYGATAIPQTVIIDRDGNVSHVFVGGSARFDDILRESLQELLSKDTGK